MSTTSECCCAEGVFTRVEWHVLLVARPMRNPDCRPEIKAAVQCLSGWEANAVCQASTLRGVTIGRVVTSGGMPSSGGGSSLDCCSLQNCRLRMGAMAVTAGHPSKCIKVCGLWPFYICVLAKALSKAM